MARPPILTLKNLHLNFGGNPLFDGLELSVEQGDRACLVGRNGSGKSTLLKVMAGMVEPDQGERFLNPGLTVAYMDQDPVLTEFATLGEFAASGVEPEETYRVEMAAEGLKLHLDVDPNSASGGERRRAALAQILARDADLMLLDEPTNHLDIEAIGWLEEYLRQTRKAFVIISHDRTFLRGLTHQTYWVDRGEMRQSPKGFEDFENWRDKIFEEEDASRHKLRRLIKAEARWAVEGISARRKRNQGRVRRLQALRSEQQGQISRSGAAKMALESGLGSGKLVIDATGISKAYDGKTLFRDLSLRVMRGECIALVGPNGAGKTSLLNVLTGVVPPDAGNVRLGANLVSALFDQNRAELDLSQSLWESLTQDVSLGVSGRSDQIMVRGQPKHVVGYLKEFLFDEGQARGSVSALSGGERARLLLARIMARESNLLILDEPTNDLDVETLDLLQELLDDYKGTCLLVSHDRDFLDRVATRTIVMDGNGNAEIYAGGWSDALALGPETKIATVTAKPQKNPNRRAQRGEALAQKSAKPAPKMSFNQSHRLKMLPAEMEQLAEEISKLEGLLADPEFYQKHPEKFTKATDVLAHRQKKLASCEEEWLELATLAEAQGTNR